MRSELVDIDAMTQDELILAFKSLFGEAGGEKLPPNHGLGRLVAQLCRRLMGTMPEPLLLDYFNKWHEWDDSDKRCDADPLGLVGSAIALVQRGQWEGAWGILQLHFDQIQKEEAASLERLNKGDPLCGLAILGRVLRSPSLVQHFAQLSSAGDVYYEHHLEDLRYGGLAPTILEQYESSREHDKWRGRIRQWLQPPNDNKPRHLEAYLAARWFGDRLASYMLELAEFSGEGGKPFVEVLLDAVETPPPHATDKATGTRFEAASGLLLSSTPGFEVRAAREGTDEQVDLVVNYERDALCVLRLPPGPGLVECKSSTESVSSDELRDFGAKCQFHRVGFGILITRKGIKGKDGKEPTAAELVRRRLLVDGLPVLYLTMQDLRHRTRELRGLQHPLAANHDKLVFGPIAGGQE